MMKKVVVLVLGLFLLFSCGEKSEEEGLKEQIKALNEEIMVLQERIENLETSAEGEEETEEDEDMVRIIQYTNDIFSDYLEIEGKVKNVGKRNVEGIQIIFKRFDSVNQFVGLNSTFTTPSILRPAEVATFHKTIVDKKGIHQIQLSLQWVYQDQEYRSQEKLVLNFD
ncbi:MAG: hypothetical protein JSU92_01040 [Deltaproteobacteria bacterium]|nr:MAG: hypothetical protein JSU92_01040 [Deltaproteobacteria bacterium]